MRAQQWAGVMVGDEAYAGSRSWKRMEQEVHDLTGFEHILPTQQGRAAERILRGHLSGAEKVFISDTHFDTTRANIEVSGAPAIDIPIPEGRDPEADHPFKGNMDVAAPSGCSLCTPEPWRALRARLLPCRREQLVREAPRARDDRPHLP